MKGLPGPLLVTMFTLGCAAQHFYANTDCDFEDDKCKWKWNTTIPNGFKVISGKEVELNLRHGQQENASGSADADNNLNGHFLIIQMDEGGDEVHVWSPRYSQTRTQCRLHVDLKMVNMTTGEFKVVIETSNETSWLIDEKMGNDNDVWETFTFLISRIQQRFRILLEITPSKIGPSELAMDNIKLVDCFPERPTFKSCSKDLFRCSTTANDFCINKTQICDIEQDCLNGADEKQGCEHIPKFARCTFEEGWCGWENSPTTAINWTRTVGTGYTRRYTGPAVDHTYQNETGNFLYVNMSTIRSTKLGSSAILESSLINPPPRYHARPNSTYYKSCYVRFFYHQYGPHTGSLGLFLIEMDPVAERSVRLWFTYGNKGEAWQRQVVQVPTNITYKYYLQFEARRGLRARGDIALDDFSMSPECFGLNVPEKEKEGYDYDNFSGFVEPTQPVDTHRDFLNKTVYLFSSCGAKGRMGPTPENCTHAYNNTNTNVTVLQDATLKGVQRWVVPREGFYTIIAKGAGGGKGYDGLGISKGAVAMGVVELNRTQSLYILVGQEGGNACRKNFAATQHYSCDDARPANNTSTTLNPIKEIQKLQIIDDGGGGGGATFVFLWSQKNGRIPLVVSSGGGGLGGGNAEDGAQHGKGMDVNRPGITGSENGNHSAGAGGGWTESNGTWREITGGSFLQGAVGGKACGKISDLHGAGGFGGGGGGCRTGGGGGGFAGGSASSERRHGLGGYSYVAHGLTIKDTFPGANTGQGSVIIIPAVKGCGCEYLCAALDEHRHKVKCICPSGSLLENNGVSCHHTEKFQPMLTEKFMLIVTSLMLLLMISCVCYFIVKHTQKNKNDRMRNKMVQGSDVQLNRIRAPSDTIMTEYNPNYEFGGGVYTIRDLKPVPREHLRLVKALGQGAFGEVYQGFFRSRTGDVIEMPVAVKTLPELSTTQAENDFMMEALIMSKFNHPNIVHFIGVCFDRHPRFIVLELLAGGDLKNFLRECRPRIGRLSPIGMKDLLLCALDIAKGCCYLEENRFIHRDIAARNCLLTTKGPGRTVKIADFGMARDIYRSDYYRKGGKAMLPIKWMPPEAFQDGIFTTKTDIWSFGVLLWEVMSFGYMPYTGSGNREVMEMVVNGGRLEPPQNCPPPIYAIMTTCWHPDPEERPCFNLIRERLGYCAQDPEVLNTPLPIFNRLSAPDRYSNATPENGLEDTSTSDYLEPSLGVPTRPECVAGPSHANWDEITPLPESQSTQPLLPQDTAGQSSTETSTQPEKKSSESRLFKALSLDAGALVSQPIPYANVKVPPQIQSTESEPEAPYSVSKNLENDGEISC